MPYKWIPEDKKILAWGHSVKVSESVTVEAFYFNASCSCGDYGSGNDILSADEWAVTHLYEKHRPEPNETSNKVQRVKPKEISRKDMPQLKDFVGE